MDRTKYIVNKVLTDIVKGYSKATIEGKEVFLMHVSPIYENEVEEYKLFKYDEAISKGLFSEKEKFALLQKDKLWTEEDDLELTQYQDMLDNLHNTRKNLLFLSQIQQLDNDIKKYEGEIAEKNRYRAELMGLTAEKYAEKKAANYYLYFTLFSDMELTKRFFKKSEFDQLDDDELNDIIVSFNSGVEYITEENIKLTALSPTVQNLYSLAESPFYFIGKPISQFSYYQTSLCSYAGYYKHILGEMGSNIPPEFRNNPDKIEGLFTSSQNIEKEKDKRQKDGGAIGFFGANEEDLAALGLNSQPDKMSKVLAEKGEFSIYDAIKMGL